MTGTQLYDLMTLVKVYHGHITGYAELVEDTEFRYWNGHGADPEFTTEIVPAETTVHVVMSSRFGDLGITKNMDVEHGYEARVEPSKLKNCRLTRTNMLRIQEHGWNWRLETFNEIQDTNQG